eukprot:TRINITY_DN206_c0_g1_i14.p1 TRINITY_DN206_c0_g1~~TRINITY_DN206_c0_g1_i14.p1  ORF type:complete len:252 (+),score=30.46 TRINITY_DN206_c0_g1_i14:454-1209(+)
MIFSSLVVFCQGIRRKFGTNILTKISDLLQTLSFLKIDEPRNEERIPRSHLKRNVIFLGSLYQQYQMFSWMNIILWFLISSASPPLVRQNLPDNIIKTIEKVATKKDQPSQCGPRSKTKKTVLPGPRSGSHSINFILKEEEKIKRRKLEQEAMIQTLRLQILAVAQIQTPTSNSSKQDEPEQKPFERKEETSSKRMANNYFKWFVWIEIVLRFLLKTFLPVQGMFLLSLFVYFLIVSYADKESILVSRTLR